MGNCGTLINRRDFRLTGIYLKKAYKGLIISPKFELIAIAIIVLLASAVRVRVAWPALSGEQGFVIGDDDDYYRLAIAFLERGTLEDSGQMAFRMPFFPLTLSSIYYVFGKVPHYAHPFIIALGVLTCIVVYIIGKEVFDPPIGFVAGLLASIDINLAFYSKFLLTETLFVFLVILSMLSLERLRRFQTWQWAIISGGFLGLAVLTRVNFGIFVFIIAAWILYYGRSRIITATRNVLIMGIMVGGLWSAWIGRNFLELGSFIPFTTQSGNAYYPVYHDVSSNRSDLVYYGYWLDIPLPDDLKASDEVGRDKELRLIASNWIRDHRNEAIKIALTQPFHFWQPEVTGDLSYLLLALAGIVGFIWSTKDKKPSVFLWGLFAIGSTFLTIPSIGLPRFRVVLHPLIAILAAFAFVTSGRRIFRNRFSTTSLLR